MTNYEPWEIDASKFPENENFQSKVKFIARYGLLAASVHNTQPWSFKLSDNNLMLSVNPEAQLEKGDPTKRESWISLGACAENIITAGNIFGMQTTVTRVSDKEVLLSFTESKPTKSQIEVSSIVARHTDRTRFSSKPINHADIRMLQSSWTSEQVKVFITQDRSIIDKVAGLTGSSIKMALSLPEFRHELSDLMRGNWTKKPDGMPGFVLGKGLAGSIIGPFIMRNFNLGLSEAKRDESLIKSANALVLVLSAGEGPKFWFEAGRAYEHVGLTATQLGISTGTFAAAVEAPEVHKEIEALIKSKYRLQTVMRLGYSNKAWRHSPRKSLDQVEVT